MEGMAESIIHNVKVKDRVLNDCTRLHTELTVVAVYLLHNSVIMFEEVG